MRLMYFDVSLFQIYHGICVPISIQIKKDMIKLLQKQNGAVFYASVYMCKRHYRPFHDGADIDATVTSLVALSNDADTKETGTIYHSQTDTHTHSVVGLRYIPLFSVTVTVTEALVLHPLLEDRGRITESIHILVTVDRKKNVFRSQRNKSVDGSSFRWSLMMNHHWVWLCRKGSDLWTRNVQNSQSAFLSIFCLAVTSKSKQFISVPSGTQVVNLVKFPQDTIKHHVHRLSVCKRTHTQTIANRETITCYLATNATYSLTCCAAILLLCICTQLDVQATCDYVTGFSLVIYVIRTDPCWGWQSWRLEIR